MPYAEVSWSYDGRYIAYRVVYLATGYRVAIWDVQDQCTVSMLDVASTPQWSPIENRIAFSASDSPHTIVYNITDGTKQQFTNGDIGSWSWSPNGRFLTIHRKDVNAKFSLSVIDVVANKTLELDGAISQPGVDASAVWSSDGRYLAVPIIEDQADYKRTIYVLDMLDKSSRRLTVDPLYYNEIAWSPVGDWLAFASRLDRGGGTAYTSLWLFDVDHHSHQEFEVNISENYHYDGLFKWSADGRYMIVRTRAGITLIDTESGQLTPIADSIRTIEMVRGSRDGTKLALISRTSTSSDIFMFTHEDGTMKNITNTPDEGETFLGWRGTKRNETLFYCGEG